MPQKFDRWPAGIPAPPTEAPSGVSLCCASETPSVEPVEKAVTPVPDKDMSSRMYDILYIKYIQISYWIT